MEIPPDTLESVGVNELFVVVTVDVSFTTEQAVVGRIDEIHIQLDMEMPPDTLEDFLTKAVMVSGRWCVPKSSLSFSICSLSPR